jgi:hypothetical protein
VQKVQLCRGLRQCLKRLSLAACKSNEQHIAVVIVLLAVILLHTSSGMSVHTCDTLCISMLCIARVLSSSMHHGTHVPSD